MFLMLKKIIINKIKNVSKICDPSHPLFLTTMLQNFDNNTAKDSKRYGTETTNHCKKEDQFPLPKHSSAPSTVNAAVSCVSEGFVLPGHALTFLNVGERNRA
jgi:hypothetical protein